MKDKALLTIVVPTRNHPKSVQFILENSFYLKKYNIYLAIHDSSTDDSTKKICENCGLENVEYFHYDDIDVDEKTIISLRSAETEYVFLCGDGIVFNGSKLYEKLLPYLVRGFDLITLYNYTKCYQDYHALLSKKYNQKDVIYKNSLEHFSENYWFMAYYGGSILRTSIFKEANKSEFEPSYNSGFVYPFTIYNVLRGREFLGVALSGDFTIQNPYKKSSGWVENKMLFPIWIDNYRSVIDMLPACYDEYKEKVKIDIGKYTHWFNFRNLLMWKSNGNFDYKKFKKYEQQILEFGEINRFELFIVLATPRWMLNVIKALRHIFKN